MVAEGSFRADLYARIAGFELELPPIAERRDDLSLFIRSALQRIDLQLTRTIRFEADALRALWLHDWPLNARQLGHVVGNAVAWVAEDGRIRTDALRLEPRSGSDTSKIVDPADVALRDELIELLESHRGNVSAVARAMGKDRRQIHRWLRRFHLEPEAYRLE